MDVMRERCDRCGGRERSEISRNVDVGVRGRQCIVSQWLAAILRKYQNFVINSLEKLGNEEDFDVQ
jgi:hypothetical protein